MRSVALSELIPTAQQLAGGTTETFVVADATPEQLYAAVKAMTQFLGLKASVTEAATGRVTVTRY
jgi:hypothetical protein